MQAKIGLAIVGLGKYATEQIIPNIKYSQHVRLAGLVSADRPKAERLAAEHGLSPKAIYTYETMGEMAQNPDIDAVYILTPNGLHAHHAAQAAAAGKHVLTEKPMATTVAECEQMMADCQKAGVKLMVGYRSHFEPFNQAAMATIKEGKLGQIRVITSEHGRQVWPAQPHDSWRVNKALAGGGSLMDIGIYGLQAACYLTGEVPNRVMATQNQTTDPRFAEVEDVIAFTLHFPSGAVAQCVSGYSFEEVKRYRVFGSEGYLDLDPATDYDKHKLLLGFAKHTEEPALKEGNQFAAQLDHFAEAILFNKPIVTDGQMGLRDVKLMLAIYQSAAEGRLVEV